MPPAIAAACFELPSGLTSKELRPPPPLAAPRDEVAADEDVAEAVDAVSCMVVVGIVDFVSAGTVRVLVT